MTFPEISTSQTTRACVCPAFFSFKLSTSWACWPEPDFTYTNFMKFTPQSKELSCIGASWACWSEPDFTYTNFFGPPRTRFYLHNVTILKIHPSIKRVKLHRYKIIIFQKFRPRKLHVRACSFFFIFFPNAACRIGLHHIEDQTNHLSLK